MKILIVNTYDIKGGAARAAYRLHQALLTSNINSSMLVQYKESNDPTVIAPPNKYQKILAKTRPHIENIIFKFYKNKQNTYFSTSLLPFSSIVKKINDLKPDIVHLHWICQAMIPIKDILKIKAPIVWSLHDNWAFTGGCHVMWQCEKYKNQCGACSQLGSHYENDLSKIVFKKKQKTFSQIDNITIVGLSRWIKKCAKESSLLKNKKIVNIPNLIDTNIYKPIDKKVAREILSLPLNKKLILFGAINATGDINKGFEKLKMAIDMLQSKNIELIIFGSNKPHNAPNFKYKTHYLGHLYDDISLQVLYSACDVMIVPSLQENLSNAIMESLSCATPVVAFNIGGNNDMIEHLKNGYLAKPYQADDLAYGIDWIINHVDYKTLSHYSRKKILQEFDSKIVINEYIKLYEGILNG